MAVSKGDGRPFFVPCHNTLPARCYLRASISSEAYGGTFNSNSYSFPDLQLVVDAVIYREDLLLYHILISLVEVIDSASFFSIKEQIQIGDVQSAIANNEALIVKGIWRTFTMVKSTGGTGVITSYDFGTALAEVPLAMTFCHDMTPDRNRVMCLLKNSSGIWVLDHIRTNNSEGD